MSMAKPPRGFTLTEALVVLALLAILSLVAIPQTGRFLLDRAYREAPHKTAALIRTAQSLAQARMQSVRVRITPTEAVVEVLEGGTWRRLERLPYPPRLGPLTQGELRFNPQGLLESPPPPVELQVGPRRLTLTRWGEVLLR